MSVFSIETAVSSAIHRHINGNRSQEIGILDED
jgi:hypothetical protein